MPDLDLARYARQLVLPGFGALAQRRLDGARVLVVGAGGLGSAVIPALAAAGVGTIGVIDGDRVETSNLPRQTLHRPEDVGRPKADSAADAVARLNPATRVEVHRERLEAGNALALLAAYDLVVDGSDNFPSRYLTDDAAALAGIPCVWGAVHQYGGRAGLSWDAHGPTYRDLFPAPPAPGSIGSCEEDGVLPTVCAVIGGIMASEVLKLLSGVGEPMLGRLISYDARTSDARTIEFGRDPTRAPISELIDYDTFCGSAAGDQQMEGAEHAEHGAGATSADDAEGPVTGQTHPEQEPPGSPPEITVSELADVVGSDEPLQLVDVREEWEASIARLPGSVLIPLSDLPFRAGELDSGARTVVYCHAGYRSEHARQILRSLDFADVRSLAGGIDEWSRVIDPSVARY